jgi:glucosyl-3-phosphoglycerate synthase
MRSSDRAVGPEIRWLFPVRTNYSSMEYVQEEIATLHAYDDPDPSAPVDRTAVVVPLADRDHGTPAAEGVFEALERAGPGRVVVALQAAPEQVGDAVDWLETFEIPLSVLWCNAPGVETVLADAGIAGQAGDGKGRDVWLALGVASDAEYVVVHDADATTFDRTQLPRLVFPLANDYTFVKGYYARVENNRLYGRLCRLFVVPLLRTLAAEHDTDLLRYLSAFRYPLAGEFATTGDLARHLRLPRGWGLEVGTLGDAFVQAGTAGTAQVDLGTHEHDHRPVAGTRGLGEMAREVGRTLLTVLEAAGVDPDYTSLPERYRATGERFVDRYAADAAFNGLEHDAAAERAQVQRYADGIAPPAADDRLPAWQNTPVDPGVVTERSAEALANLGATPRR